MEKKTILITGGAAGFGKEVAKKVAAKGWRIIIGARNEKKMDTQRSRRSQRPQATAISSRCLWT